MSIHFGPVPQEKMWKVIEEYGIKRDALERSQPTSRELEQLYYLIKKNKRLRKDIQTVRRLKDFVETGEK